VLFAAVSALLAMLLASTACGYRVASRNRTPLPFRSIAVRPLENETTVYEVEQILTRALVQELVKRSDLQVTSDESGADTLLTGAVQRVTVSPIGFSPTGFASTFLVTVYARLELVERATGKRLFNEPNYAFRDQYIINADVAEFFSEANPALHRIAEDFAASAVATILEDF
jgi:hypothetical protein